VKRRAHGARRLFPAGRALDLEHQLAGIADRRHRRADFDQPLSIVDSSGKTGWLGGFYAQDEWKVWPNVTLNFGARFDMVRPFTHESQLSPRVNVVWQPTEATTFHAGYSRYFTPPPFELVAPTTIALLANTTGPLRR